MKKRNLINLALVVGLSCGSLMFVGCPNPAKDTKTDTTDTTKTEADKKSDKIVTDFQSEAKGKVVSAKAGDNDVSLNFSGDGKEVIAEVSSVEKPEKLVVNGETFTNFVEGTAKDAFGTKQSRKVWISAKVSVTISLAKSLSGDTITFTLENSSGSILGNATVPAQQALGADLAKFFNSVRDAIIEITSGISGPSGAAG